MIIAITISTLVFFNIAFFLIGGSDTGSAAGWIAYVFIHFAGLCQIVTPLLFTSKEATVASVGASLKVFSLIHFLVVLVAGIVIMLISPEGWKASFLVFLFITLAYLTLLFAMCYSYRKVLRQ